MAKDLTDRLALDARHIGPAHQGSPLVSPLSPTQSLRNAEGQGLTGGIKGALVVNGSFVNSGFAGSGYSTGFFSGFSKDTVNSFLDTSYFSMSGTTITVLKSCYYMLIADGNITLSSNPPGPIPQGVWTLGMLVHFVGGGTAGNVGSSFATLLPSKNYNFTPPLMTNGNNGDTITVFSAINTIITYDPLVGTDGVCRLQFLVVG